MVARGLEKLLKVEQRELLMGMLVGVCKGESRRSAAEALGLVCDILSVAKFGVPGSTELQKQFLPKSQETR